MTSEINNTTMLLFNKKRRRLGNETNRSKQTKVHTTPVKNVLDNNQTLGEEHPQSFVRDSERRDWYRLTESSLIR